MANQTYVAFSKDDFKKAYEALYNPQLKNEYKSIWAAIEKYAKNICYNVYKDNHFVRSTANKALIKLYEKIDNYDPQIALFSTYMYDAVFNTALSEKKKMVITESAEEIESVAENCNSLKKMEHGDFVERLRPYIQEYTETLNPIKKQIMLAAYGAAIFPDQYYCDGKYGYAQILSEKIGLSPNHIRKILSVDILPDLREYIIKKSGLNSREIVENLYFFCRSNPRLSIDDLNSLTDGEINILFNFIFG